MPTRRWKTGEKMGNEPARKAKNYEKHRAPARVPRAGVLRGQRPRLQQTYQKEHSPTGVAGGQAALAAGKCPRTP